VFIRRNWPRYRGSSLKNAHSNFLYVNVIQSAFNFKGRDVTNLHCCPILLAWQTYLFARTGAFLREWALAARFAASMKFTRLQPEARAIGGRMAAKAPVQNQPSERPFCYQVE
jgi:hypothetical protein